MTQNIFPNTDTSATTRRAARSTLRRVFGYALSALPCALVLMSGAAKVYGKLSPEIADGLRHVGVDTALARPIGILELVVVAICLIPRTSFIGTILFTGWAGGAIMTHLRVGDPVVVQVLLPIVVWIGVALRNPTEIATLLRLRKAA